MIWGDKMNFITALNQVVILFAIMLVGFFARKKKILDQATNHGFTEFLLNVTIPFTIISSFNQSLQKDVLFNASLVFIFSFSIHLLSIFIGQLLYCRYENDIKKVLWFTAVFANCAFMGFPVVESIYGKVGVLYGSVYTIPFNLFVWTFGQILFSGKRDIRTIKNAVLNSSMAAVVIGVAVLLSPVKLPLVLSKVIDMLGSLTTPLSMIIVGSMLAEVKLKELFSGLYIYYSTVVRLFIIPLLVLFILKSIGLTGTLLGVCVILTAMPTASFSVIFAEKFGGNVLIASRCVFFSTAVSIITIPIILLLI